MNAPLGQSPQSSSAPILQGSITRTDRRVLINTSALTVSSLWRIGLSFILQLLIANRLGAEGLGQYTTALAFLNVCQVLSELGLPQLLVRDLASSPGRRLALFRAALLVQFTAAILVWGLLIALTFLLPYQATTRYALITITASLPLYAISSVCMTMFQSGERMELVMGIEVIVNVLIVVGSIWALWRGGTVIHLAAVFIGTQMVSATLCLWQLRHSRLLQASDGDLDRKHLSFGEHLRHFRRSARSFYGLSLANVLLHRIDILLISIVAGEVITGIYSAAYLMVRIFMILSQTYWQALYPTLSRLHRQAVEHYRLLATLGLRYGLMLLLPVAVLGGAVAQPLLRLIFRDELYEQSVGVLQVLIWIVPLYFLATYAVNLLLVEHRPSQSLRIALVHLIATCLLLPPLALRWQALGAAYAVLIGVALSVVVGFSILYRTGIAIYFPQHWLLLISTLLTLAVMQIGGRFLSPTLWVFNLLLGGIVYIVLLWQGKLLSVADLQLFRKALQR